MRQIGRRAAELHNALASRSDIADFAPEPISAADVRTWTTTVLQRVENTLDDLAAKRDRFGGSDRASAEALLARRDDVLGQIGSCLPEQIEAACIRHHGDLHLGQMLFAKDNVFIIDFEGEPQRSLAERRRKGPPARDVAGVLRSVDYAATAAFDRAQQAWPDDHGHLLVALERWRQAAADAFLSAYRESLTNPVLWPRERAEADRLLKFFLLEKVFYEVDYELANRPTWLHIPLAGAHRILFATEGKADE
jgi:maltose alpha-D-glucosyltransferase/alpha-amylase